MFWVLPINYEKTILGIFVYLLICKDTTAKGNFSFYKQWGQGATRLICKRCIFAQKCYYCVLALIFLYKLKKIPWKKHVRFWKWTLNCTHHLAQNSFSRKSNLKFCIFIYNSQVTKPSYNSELRIMTSQTELLTLNSLFLIFRVSNSM